MRLGAGGGRIMVELALKDGVYFLVLAAGVTGSHFMLRARVMVLEERLKGHSKAVERIFEMLSRIESKLDEKADK